MEPLPTSAQGCRARLAELQDEISSIRIQIATTDIRRQSERRTLDPDWYHRAKTALRTRQLEVVKLSAQLGRLGGAAAGRRERFKDLLIDVLRAEFDDADWAKLVARARALEAGRDG